MNYYVYILHTSSNTLYIGQTNNLDKRIQEHRNKSSKSAKYIRYFKTCELVYSEEYSTRKEAMQREAQLKKWSRKKKDALIQKDSRYRKAGKVGFCVLKTRKTDGFSLKNRYLTTLIYYNILQTYSCSIMNYI